MENLEKQNGRFGRCPRLARMGRLVLVLLSSFALAPLAGGAVAAAEPPPGGQPATTQARAGGNAKVNASSNTNADVTEYRFDDELVQGDLLNPNGEVLRVRNARQKTSLIHVRTGFIEELLESANDL